MNHEPQTTNHVFLKTLSIYYYFLFFLLNSVAKKFYEIRATNYYFLCKTNPIFGKDGNAPTSLLLTTNDQRLTTREAQNKPNQTQFSLSLLRNVFPCSGTFSLHLLSPCVVQRSLYQPGPLRKGCETVSPGRPVLLFSPAQF